MVTCYYLLSPMILSSSASPSIKLLVVLQFLPSNNIVIKTTERRECSEWSYLYTSSPFSTLLPCFLYWKARNSCFSWLWCPAQLFHIHPVALSICWQVGKLTVKRSIVALGGFGLRQAWPLCLALEQNVCSSRSSLSTAVGYILVDENRFRSISILRSEQQCPEYNWTRPVCNGMSVSGWASLWRSQPVISPPCLRNRAFHSNPLLGPHFGPENLATGGLFGCNPSFYRRDGCPC